MCSGWDVVASRWRLGDCKATGRIWARRDRGAIGDAGGAERAIIGDDDMARACAHSDQGKESRRVLGRWPVGQPDFKIFQYSKSYQTCKFKYTTFPRSKNIQTWHEVAFDQIEQLCQLAQLKIPTVSHDINFGTNSNLNLQWILMGFKPYGENLVNSLEFFLDTTFHTVNWYWLTCMKILEAPLQVVIMTWFNIFNENIWIWKWTVNQDTLLITL
jgi:hypothetical protein